MKYSEKLIDQGRKVGLKYPFLKPILRIGRILIGKKKPAPPRFSGWGMTTNHQLPWVDEYDGEVFRKASLDIKKKFEWDKNVVGYNSSKVDELLWRHWNVSRAIIYAIKFTSPKTYNFVECGTGEGMSAFFALREISQNEKVNGNFFMHLYDSWKIMKKEVMTEKEVQAGVGKNYQLLNINKTKQNLSDFYDEHIVYHIGYVPETFNLKPDAPTSISYLHIDLNSVNATKSTLEFFYPRLESGGVILFDDYGWVAFEETKKLVDKFFHNKPGIFLKFPTGQAMYCQP